MTIMPVYINTGSWLKTTVLVTTSTIPTENEPDHERDGQANDLFTLLIVCDLVLCHQSYLSHVSQTKQGDQSRFKECLFGTT